MYVIRTGSPHGHNLYLGKLFQSRLKMSWVHLLLAKNDTICLQLLCRQPPSIACVSLEESPV